jgi:tetratricopeptide (TPR) repeat protein
MCVRDGRKVRPLSLERIVRIIIFTLMTGIATLAWPHAAAAQRVKAEVSAAIENGFARILIQFAEEVETQVRSANGIVVIAFDRPVDINVDRLSAEGYISAARRDPDGRGIRIALARKMTVNPMAAGERLFVDLLPNTWTGMAPGLPREVIDDLARRARDAEKMVRLKSNAARQAKMVSIRVRATHQPTFSRYTFELPAPIGVASDMGRDRLTLTFDTLLKFDLADAQASLPASIQSIDSEVDKDAVVVRFNFGAKVDVRTFREDNNYVVDVSAATGKVSQEMPSKVDELAALAYELAGRKPATAAETKPPQSAAPQTVATPVAAAQSGAIDPPKQGQEGNAALTTAAPDVPAGISNAVPAAMPTAVNEPPSRRMSPSMSAAATSNDKVAGPTHGPDRASVDAPVPAVTKPRDVAAAPTGDAALPQMPKSAASRDDPGSSPEARMPAASAVATAPSEGSRDPVVTATFKPQGENLALIFPFANPTPAAVFRRADTLWLVFDTEAAISLKELQGEPTHNINAMTVDQLGDGVVVRLKLLRPRLVSATAEGNTWTINLGSENAAATRPLSVARNAASQSGASAAVAFDGPNQLHRLTDPEAGDTLMVVTGLAPGRGFSKTQDFVEFRALASSHGIVIQPLADDLQAALAADRVNLTRPNGLTLSARGRSDERTPVYTAQVLDTQLWGFDREAEFAPRNSQLISTAAAAADGKRLAARIELARFYLAREMSAEAKAVLDVALVDSPPTADSCSQLVLHAIASIMLGRPELALKDLGNPLVGNQFDAPLWRAVALARQGKWSDARDGFRNVEAALGALPLELQRSVLKEMARSALEVGDVTGAVAGLRDMELVGVPREMEPALSVLTGRLAESRGHVGDAVRAYQTAADSWDRAASAQGRLREIVLQSSLGAMNQVSAINDLETLTAVWRGDETEIEGLQLLARLYTKEGRYREAFHVMRTALKAHPNSDMTRKIHEEAAATFDNFFLAGRGDAMPAIDALALFYDFRELTPIGRRGDEMIRRLADRLVSVDLLDQAAELLQHQVDHRLQGAARAQVASRLAVVYLMNHKPDRALAVLQSSRSSDLNSEIRRQRLLLEARALSDVGRHNVAIEVISNIDTPEATRLRADIFWAAKRWRDAAEQMEFMLADRWKQFEPLNDLERTDVLRAAIGYAMGEDSIGLSRFRERYTGKMADGPDQRAFEIVTAPIESQSAEFPRIARSIAAVDTLEAFLRDMRTRYPATGPTPGIATPAPPRPAQPAASAAAPARTASR